MVFFFSDAVLFCKLLSDTSSESLFFGFSSFFCNLASESLYRTALCLIFASTAAETAPAEKESMAIVSYSAGTSSRTAGAAFTDFLSEQPFTVNIIKKKITDFIFLINFKFCDDRIMIRNRHIPVHTVANRLYVL